MLTKSILTAAAIALVAGFGSASTADQFSTLDGVTAVPMSSGELGTVVGSRIHFRVSPPGTDSMVHTASFAGTGLDPKLGGSDVIGSGKGLHRAAMRTPVITVLCPGLAVGGCS